MDFICLILFILIIALWFFADEYPVLYGVYVPTCALKRSVFKTIVAIVIVLSVFFCSAGAVGANMAVMVEDIDVRPSGILIVSLVSLIVLVVLKLLSIRGSSVYAILGAMCALNVMNGNPAGGILSVAISVLVSPVMALILSVLLSGLMKTVFARTHVHLLLLSHYMRIVTISGIVLVSLALGLNLGGFIFGVTSPFAGEKLSALISSGMIALVLLFMTPFMRDESDESAGMYSDLSIYNVLSIGFAVAFTLLFFSFEGTASLLGLAPAPLSVGSLMLSAVAGVSLVQKSPLIEAEEYTKEIVALLVAPAGSFLLTCLVLSVSGSGGTGMLTEFGVIVLALLVLMPLAFIGYMRRHRSQRKAVERLVYSQQQQIYENSRALNDMELKVVLSENQALHNAVEMKKQEVMNVALSIVEQKEYLESLNAIVKKLAKSKDEQERNRLIAELSGSLKQRLSYDRDVDSQYFYAQAEYLHEDFNAKLSENFPDLTQQERRLATLLRLGFSSKYIATLMNITPKSVEISRYRLRQKLGLSKGDNLVNFIKSI